MKLLAATDQVHSYENFEKSTISYDAKRSQFELVICSEIVSTP